MKIKISKSQWEQVGKKAGWMKQSQFKDKMMPGQTPYTTEEKAKLYSLVGDAAKGDQGEEFDDIDPYIKMRPIRITFDNGDVIETTISGTKKDIQEYYFPNGKSVATDYDPNRPDALRRPKQIQFLNESTRIKNFSF